MSTDTHALPDLHEMLGDALALFSRATPPRLPEAEWREPLLVVGSGNAAAVGRIICAGKDARYADESTYETELSRHQGTLRGAVLVSASGGKDAPQIAMALRERGIPTWLLTTNAGARAAEYVDPARVVVFPKNPEPYTYNVSTYLGMLLSRTGEDPTAIRLFLSEKVAPAIPQTLSRFDAFYFILPPHLLLLKEMFITKFDELFGSRVSVRAYTPAQSRHAKTVVPSEGECFVAFGEGYTEFGTPETRVHLPLPPKAGYAAACAVGYFFIGQVQKQHPPYFKEHLPAYVRQASAQFGEEISVLVS